LNVGMWNNTIIQMRAQVVSNHSTNEKFLSNNIVDNTNSHTSTQIAQYAV